MPIYKLDYLFTYQSIIYAYKNYKIKVFNKEMRPSHNCVLMTLFFKNTGLDYIDFTPDHYGHFAHFKKVCFARVITIR